MNLKQLVPACLLAVLALAPARAQHEEHAAVAPGGAKFGTVKFPTSCSPAA